MDPQGFLNEFPKEELFFCVFCREFFTRRRGGGEVKGGPRNDYPKIYDVFYNRNSRHMLPVVSNRQIEDKQGGGVGQFCVTI